MPPGDQGDHLMARAKSDQSDETPGAPEWMLTYSDCMTLLLTFFVLLISFSSFDDKIYRKMESAFIEGLASLGVQPTKDRRSFLDAPQIVHREALDKGSEHPTKKGTYESNPNESLDFQDFQSQKVFLLPSDRLFLGRGVRMSDHGRQVLADIAVLLNATSNRIIISEYAPQTSQSGDDLGLLRAWSITTFLAERQGLDATRLGISSAGTVPDVVHSSAFLRPRTGQARVTEIVILDRSTYR
jgi:chemotaxis protein MotB